MIEFIDTHRGEFGVDPICQELQIAPSSYYAANARPPSPRAVRDEQLKAHVQRVFEDNYSCYGVRKMYLALREEGVEVARCTVERLMRALGLVGTSRGHRKRVTTTPATGENRPPDLLRRDFTAPAPNTRWVADITYIRTLLGFVYAAFIIDVYSRMVVGFAVSSSLRAELAVDALEMAVARRGPHLTGLIHHSDRGSQYLSLRYTQRLADAGIAPSVGTAGDSYDNALAESFIGLYKTELIDNPTLAKIWAGRRHVEHGTAAYLYWFNTRRFHSACDDRTPAAYEVAYHAAQQPASA